MIRIQYLNPTPKTTIWDILAWIRTQNKEIITTSDIISEFKLTPSDACHRLQRMRKIGLLKYFDKKKKIKGGFVLTEYGIRFIIKKNNNQQEE